MKTKEELFQKIDGELIWRRRELTNFKATIQDSDTSRRDGLLRAGTALLYAHWEGFVKKTGTYYLDYIIEQRHKGRELKANILAIKLKNKLNSAFNSSSVSSSREVIDFFLTKLDHQFRFSSKGVVNTGSNLSSNELKEIFWVLGLDIKWFETKFKFIDSSLVNKRNHIAHGSFIDIELGDYFSIHDEVLAMLNEFRNQLENAATTNNHLN